MVAVASTQVGWSSCAFRQEAGHRSSLGFSNCIPLHGTTDVAFGVVVVVGACEKACARQTAASAIAGAVV